MYPFSLLYNLVVKTRNILYDKGLIESIEFKTSSIVVGNLSVGGTGKTPQIEYLVELLKDAYKVAVLSRGYKRKTRGYILANDHTDAKIIGDEPHQFYQKFPTINVAVSEDRARGIEQLEKLDVQPDVILLDDAFQHRKVRGGYNILLTAYNDLYVNDNLLPTGNLREGISGAKRAQLIIVTKCPKTLSQQERDQISLKLKPKSSQSVFFTSIEYDTNIKGSTNIELEELKNTKIILLTGIANPQPLVDFLRSKKIEVEHMKFPDHYDFTDDDLAKIRARSEELNTVILTTEKDYVRISDRLENMYYIQIKVKFIDLKSKFDNLIKNYVGKSSRDS